MRRTFVFFSLCLLCVLPLGMAACGSDAQPGFGSSATPGETPTPTKKTATPGAPTSVPSQKTPGASTTVEVIVSKTSYARQEAITVTISNRSAQSIFAAINPSSCTIIQLERQTSAGWQAQRLCSPLAATSMLAITAQSSKTIVLKPRFPGIQPATTSGTWTVGTYRVVLAYHPAPDPDTIGGGTQVYSQNFAIA